MAQQWKPMIRGIFVNGVSMDEEKYAVCELVPADAPDALTVQNPMVIPLLRELVLKFRGEVRVNELLDMFGPHTQMRELADEALAYLDSLKGASE